MEAPDVVGNPTLVNGGAYMRWLADEHNHSRQLNIPAAHAAAQVWKLTWRAVSGNLNAYNSVAKVRA